MPEKSHKKELIEIRKAVRKYLDVIACVPIRAIDCDQELEEKLWGKLAKLSGYKINHP